MGNLLPMRFVSRAYCQHGQRVAHPTALCATLVISSGAMRPFVISSGAKRSREIWLTCNTNRTRSHQAPGQPSEFSLLESRFLRYAMLRIAPVGMTM
jgi:hypothetical protein